MYTRKTELFHYGVKGMKWGIRRTPKELGHKKQKSKEDAKSGDEKSGLHLTSGQKKAIAIGAGVVAASLAVYGAYKLGAFDRLKKNGLEPFIDMGVEIDLPAKKTGGISIADAIKNVNPTNSKTNCRATAMATVLRMKGVDCEALDVQGGSLSDAVKTCFKNARVTEMYSPSKDSVNSYILKKFPEGSSGVMSATYRMHGSDWQHAITWAVRDSKVLYADGQQGVSDFSRFLSAISPNNSAEISRIDDLEIDPEGIKKFIRMR